jgi:hypothetical protein
MRIRRIEPIMRYVAVDLSRPLSVELMTRWLEQRAADRHVDDGPSAAKVLNLGTARVFGSTGA